MEVNTWQHSCTHCTYRCEELWRGNRRTVIVQLDPTAQVEVTDLHRRNLIRTEVKKKSFKEHKLLDILVKKTRLSRTFAYDLSNSQCQALECTLIFWLWNSSQWRDKMEKNETKTKDLPCPRVHIRCFQAWGLCAPCLQDTNIYRVMH